MHNLRKIIYLIVAVVLMVPAGVLADGIIVPPFDYMVYETDQKAVIFYEDGVEIMVVSISFEGDADDFGWLIPVPSQPTVAKSSDELFVSLQDITTEYYDGGFSSSYHEGVLSDDIKSSVTIIETQNIDYYEVTTLQASDSDALSGWLEENEYNFPSGASSVLTDYIDNSWYFVAMKINAQELNSLAEQDLMTGHATPIEIKFASDKIVYPLKISGAMAYFNQDDSKPGSLPSYKEGKTGRSISLKANDVLYNSLANNFNSQSGSIAFWIKDADLSTPRENHEFISIVDSLDKNILQLRSSGEYLQFITTAATGEVLYWQADTNSSSAEDWHHIAYTWNVNEAPMIYFDGQAVVTKSTSSDIEVMPVNAINPTSSGSIYIGQPIKASPAYPIDGLIDELVFFQAPLTSEQISRSYQLGSYELYDSLLWSASFENNLTYTRRDGTSDSLIYFREAVESLYTPPSSVNLLLYVITDHKQSLPGFTNSYAGWLSKKEAEELAYNDQMQPWILPTKKKYFLTKFTRYMNVSEMKNDLIFRQASDDSVVNAPEPIDDTRRLNFNVVMLTGSFLTAGLLVVITYLLNKKEKNIPPKKKIK
ncbi:DUF2330 domain-containing protein [Patescibacteria group bacterium]|nr:DUF2330 domain-containing protein [Patescibacteria group bacterium]MBU1890946.1 DUF2330 domain-containing protein [Patescibacteria group bacterium]